MAGGRFALPAMTAAFNSHAQQLMSFMVGPYCMTGHALFLGFIVVDVKLVLGLCMWGGVWYSWFHEKQHTSAHVRVNDFFLKMMMTCGFNFTLLSITQYHDQVWLHMWMTVACLLGIILFNSFLVMKLFPGKNWVPPESGEMRIDSIYEDLSKPLTQLVVIFVLQTSMCILALYTSVLKESGDMVKQTDSSFAGFVLEGKPSTDDDDVGCYLFWVVGFLVQMGAYFQRGYDSSLGRPWHIQEWQGIEQMRESLEFECGKDCWRPLSKNEVRIRSWFGFLANTLYRDVIAFLTPLVLLKSDSAMDVAQNALALSYITTLDDVKDCVMKFRALPDCYRPL